MEVESSNINHSVGSPGNQLPALGSFQKSLHEHKVRNGWKMLTKDTHFTVMALELFQELETILNTITKDVPIALIENYKGFRSCVPGTGTKTKCIFLIINHSITMANSIFSITGSQVTNLDAILLNSGILMALDCLCRHLERNFNTCVEERVFI